jgi:hypothetical protein
MATAFEKHCTVRPAELEHAVNALVWLLGATIGTSLLRPLVLLGAVGGYVPGG